MAQPVYRIFAPFSIKCRRMDDSYLVYHGGTGNTHCLEGDMASVFARIYENPSGWTFDALYNCAALAREDLEFILSSLSAHYLIERVD